MGHLNELHEEYADKGFHILAVSAEPTSAIEGFIEEFDAKYPMITQANDAMSEYGIAGYPSAYLVGPDGEVLWAGHPGSFQTTMIEEHLDSVEMFPDMPKSLKAVEKSMKSGKYGDALKKVEALITKGKLPDEDKDLAEKLRANIDGRATKGFERAAKSLREGDAYKAYQSYEKIETGFKGHAHSKTAKEHGKKLMGDKIHKTEIKAAEKWAKIKPQLKGMAAKKALALLKPLLSKKYAETKAGKKAAEKARNYEHALK